MRKKRGPWTITATRILYRAPWLHIQEDRVITPAGKPGKYTYTVAKDGAIVIPLDTEGRVHLIKEFKYPAGRVLLQAPGGGVDRGETPLTAAKRELQEEVGLTAKRWTRLGVFYPFPSSIHTRTYLYLAEDLTEVSQELEGTETIETVTMPLTQALRMAVQGTIADGETIVALFKMQSLHKRRLSAHKLY